MKKIFLMMVVGVMIQGCVATAHKVYLKGKYQTTPYIIEVNKPKQEVWDKVVDMMIQKGWSIKLMDTQSGLIISDRIRFGNNDFTTEDQNGRLVNEDAYLVFERCSLKSAIEEVDRSVQTAFAEWNVRVTEKEGKTYVNVNLVNISGKGFETGYVYGYQVANPCEGWQGLSTGKFERSIMNEIAMLK